jgi:hypothetical protein
LKKGGLKMPYLITTSLYPSEKAPEVATRYLEALTKYPPDESLGTETVPVAVKSTHQGIKGISISDVQKGKLDAAYTRAVNMMVMFQSIAGFVYTVEVYLKIEEAMSAIGMDMP